MDVGGTFTDVVTIEDGSLSVHKTPTTPEAPDEGVLRGMEASRTAGGYAADDVTDFAHGTTVSANAVIERDWAKTALVTTAGFRDVLEIGRQARPNIYGFDDAKPDPVVPRNRRFEVAERLDESGRVESPLAEDDLEAVADALAATDIESVAVALLFAFENDAHERRVRDHLSDELDAPISLSSEIHPEIREYERTLVTALNAALTPGMAAYLDRLRDRLVDRGVPARPRIMHSNGGTISAEQARRRPVKTLLSGPAAGVQGAAHVARLRDEDVISMDMGGTSCDVSLVRDGAPTRANEHEVGEYPIRLPMLDIHTIGAGGGSIARVDAGGALRVGPRSAGARPGPICYGRGGEEPTVTDAHLVLGRLDPERFLPNGHRAEFDAVATALTERVAGPLDLSLREAAEGVIKVANASMERALRVVSVERGHDPREFSLVAFGGAGPLHATALARRLQIPRVLVPRAAGVLSALGLLVTDRMQDFSTSMVRPLAEVDPSAIASTFAAFERDGIEHLDDGDADGDLMVERALDLRYVGQSFDLSVPVPVGPIDAGTLAAIEERFHRRHERRYGHADPAEPVELVTVRLRARRPIEPPSLSPPKADGSTAAAVRTQRPVVFDDTPEPTRIYLRSELPADGSLEGPAVVEGEDTTIVIEPGQRAVIDEYGTLVIEVDP